MTLKVQMLGKIGTGVTSVILRAVDDVYHEGYISTMGVNYKAFYAGDDGDDGDKIELWDIKNDRRFPPGVHSFIQRVDLRVVCIDMCAEDWKTSTEGYLAEIERCGSLAPCLFLATKCDSGDKKVSEEELRKFATEKHYPIMFVDSKTGNGFGPFKAKLVEFLRLQNAPKNAPKNKMVIKGANNNFEYKYDNCLPPLSANLLLSIMAHPATKVFAGLLVVGGIAALTVAGLGIGGVIGGVLATAAIGLAVGGGLGIGAGVGAFAGSFFAGQYRELKKGLELNSSERTPALSKP
jgi:GTPase SAR1 family protein